MKLYDYWRSSAAYRVRIVLKLKGLEYEQIPVNLAKGEQRDPAFLARNPMGLVPALELSDGSLVTQSMAIAEYLDETYHHNGIFPQNSFALAEARAFCLTIVAETHPLYNLRVRKYLVEEMGHSDDDVTKWYAHWSLEGLSALEKMAENLPDRGEFLFGHKPGFAEACLVPQFYNCQRFGIDLSHLPRLTAAYNAVKDLEAFKAAEPENQPDAE